MRTILAIGLSLVFGTGVQAAPADPALSELLQGYTQALSTAGLNGDRATLDKYLDADVVYMVEDGSRREGRDVIVSRVG